MRRKTKARAKRNNRLDMRAFHGIPLNQIRALRSQFVRDCLAKGIQYPEQMIMVMNDVSTGITRDAVAGFKAAEARGE